MCGGDGVEVADARLKISYRWCQRYCREDSVKALCDVV